MICARTLLPLALTFALSCVPPQATPPPGSWEYIVDAPADGTREIGVEATFKGARTERLAIEASANAHVKGLAIRDGATWRPVSRQGDTWSEPACARECTLHYRIDLGDIAETCDGHVDCAMRVGAATLSPALAWLIHPSPKLDVPARLRVRTQNPAQFASGLRSAGAPLSFTFRSIELDEGSFTAFGPMRRARAEVKGGTLDLVFLGKGMKQNDDAIGEWIVDSAGLVTSFFGRFPVAHATVFVVPVPDTDDVVLGKVLSLAGASVAILVGADMPRTKTHDDWVLVHELFHLGFPSFRGEGRWLGEGLATYYEPILRARGGWLSEKQLWAFFAHEMHRGLPRKDATGAEPPLVQRDDIDGIYWGGALFALLADVALRKMDGPRAHSLDEVMRATLARDGDATHVWTVADVMRFADESTQTHVMTDLCRTHAMASTPIDLDALLASLGVELRASGEVVLHDDRPLSKVRKGIISTR